MLVKKIINLNRLRRGYTFVKFNKAFIPYGGYHSTPFARWNGSLKAENSVVLTADTARRWFVEKQIDPTVLDFIYYGITTAQPLSFYSHVYSSAVILDRKKNIPGMQVNQVCATSCTTMGLAASDVENGAYETVYALSGDRCSSTPLLVVPTPNNGSVATENIVTDNFKRDPSPDAGLAMFETAEAVAKEAGITRQECDDTALLRYEQYLDATANERAFQKRYMFPVRIKEKKQIKQIDADEGIAVRTKESLAAYKTVVEGGVLTSGTQCHPADGSCGVIVTTKEKAQELSAGSAITVQVISYGAVRVAPGRVASAPVPALTRSLKDAGLRVGDLKQIKTHNPFIVNDIYLGKQMGIEQKYINNYGSPMVFGHPQAPTAGRAIIELIEALAVQGGGYGAFTGCAAGDIGASLIVKVS